jgi:uncharacterized protein YegJ (DUF2314 family)
MSEKLSNVAVLCTKHAPKPCGLRGHDMEELIGSHIKVFLKVQEPTRSQRGISREHVWIKVTAVISKSWLAGTIDNQPIYATQYHYGQRVNVNPDHIEDILFSSERIPHA